MRAAAALAALSVAAALAACGSDSATGPSTQKSPAGAYAIASINAGALPVAIFSDTGGFRLEVTSGTISLTSGGQYSIVTSYREILTGVSDTYTDSTSGTWTLNSATNTVVFTDGSDGSTDQATWSNTGQLTFVEPGLPPAMNTFVYKLSK